MFGDFWAFGELVLWEGLGAREGNFKTSSSYMEGFVLDCTFHLLRTCGAVGDTQCCVALERG